MAQLLDNKTYVLYLLERLRDDLHHEHYCGTSYEDEEHDPFDGRNGGNANTGYNWEGNGPCVSCSLLLEVDKVIEESGGKSRDKKI